MAESLLPAPSGHDAPRYVAARYRLDSPIGRGGAGVVWRGEDELLQRPVAVKEILVPLAGAPNERDAIRVRVLREARALARLHSPSIVSVYDVVEEAERHWIVMELVDADSLGEVIKTHGPLPFGQVAAIGLALTDALAAAHSAGVLHRDVKPGNVLMGRDGRVRLTDFGIAATEGDATLTGTGALVGSPAYIAPERVRGASGTPASDLWGLAATLYSAVEGSPPFEGPETYAVLTAVVEGRRRPFRLAGPLRGLLTDLLDNPAPERPGVDEIRRRLAPIARNANPVPTWMTNTRHQPGTGDGDRTSGADVLENVVEPMTGDRDAPSGGAVPEEPKTGNSWFEPATPARATKISTPAGRGEGGAAGAGGMTTFDAGGTMAFGVGVGAAHGTSAGPVTAPSGGKDAPTEAAAAAAATDGMASAAWPPGVSEPWPSGDGEGERSGLLPVAGDVKGAPGGGNPRERPWKAAVIAVAAAVAAVGAAIALSGLLSSGDGTQRGVNPAANGSSASPATVADETTTWQNNVSNVTQIPEPAQTRLRQPTSSPYPTAQVAAQPEPVNPGSPSPTPAPSSPTPAPSPSPTGDGSPSPTPSASTTPEIPFLNRL